jgi:DNA-binding beta-propeller fold protein YncE
MIKKIRRTLHIGIATAVLSALLPILGGIVAPASVSAQNTPYKATSEVGQPDFTTSDLGTSQTMLNGPWGSDVAVDHVRHLLFTTDGFNNRIMVFQLTNSNTLPMAEGATYVLGQTGFNSGSAGLAHNQMTDPSGLVYDSAHDRLFAISGSGVYVYDLSNGISSGMAATYVLGQSGFGVGSCLSGQNGLCINNEFGALALDTANNLLFVTDNGNNRIMVFDVNPSSIQTGENATHVIGQTNFSSNITGTASRTNFKSTRSGLAFDAAHKILFVTDNGAERVLVFNLTNGITDGMAASNVLGQTNFTNNGAGTSASTLDSPYGLAYDSADNQLFVDDTNNDRILVFDLTNGNTDGMNASGVLGQPDFTTGTFYSSSSQTNSQGGYTANMYFDTTTHTLYFGSYYDSRVLAYSFVHMTGPSSLGAGTIGQSYSQTFTSIQSQGIVTYRVIGGSLPPGLNLDGSTGVISGTPTTPGSYNFEITAYDDNGAIGTFIHDPSFSITINANSLASLSGSNVKAPQTGFGAPASSGSLVTLTIIGAVFFTLAGVILFPHPDRKSHRY